MTSDEFKKVIAGISASYINFNLNEIQLKFWYDNVKDLVFDEIRNGLKKWIQIEKYPPTIADIRKMRLTSTNALISSEQFLYIVHKSVSKYGLYNTVEALDYIKGENELAYKIVKEYGYRNICMNNKEFVNSHLIKMFNETKSKSVNEFLITTELKEEINKDTINGTNLIEIQ